MALPRIKSTAKMVLPHLALLSAALLWGAGFIVTKIGLESSGPFAFVALRFGAATLFLGILLRRSLTRLTRREMTGGFFVALFGAFGSVCVGYALQTEPSARVVFLAALYVPLVPVLQWSLFRLNPGMKVWAGVALAVCGVGVMAGVASTTEDLSMGDWFALASAGFVAMQVIVLGRVSQGVNTVRLAWASLLFTLFIAAISAYVIGEPAPSVNPTLFWIIVGFGVSTAYIQFAMGWGQTRLDASKASILYATEPVFGGLIGWIAGEALGASDIVGGLLIIAGVLIGAMPRTPRKRRRFIATRGWLSTRFGIKRKIVQKGIELP